MASAVASMPGPGRKMKKTRCSCFLAWIPYEPDASLPEKRREVGEGSICRKSLTGNIQRESCL